MYTNGYTTLGYIVRSAVGLGVPLVARCPSRERSATGSRGGGTGCGGSVQAALGFLRQSGGAPTLRVTQVLGSKLISPRPEFQSASSRKTRLTTIDSLTPIHEPPAALSRLDQFFSIQRSMRAQSEIVRSLLAWSLRTVMRAESQGASHTGPRLAEFQLGRLMHRSDAATAMSIAEDVTGTTWDSGLSPDEILSEISRIRAAAASPPRASRHRTLDSHRGYWLAVELIRRSRVGLAREQRRLLEQGALCSSFRQLATDHWSGRDPMSLRDDFDRIAEEFHRREKFFLSQVAQFVVKEGTIKKGAS